MRILNKEIWPYKISSNYLIDGNKQFKECHQWLEEHVGPYQDEWNMVYYYRRHTDYYFKNGHHATLFALRWS